MNRRIVGVVTLIMAAVVSVATLSRIGGISTLPRRAIDHLRAGRDDLQAVFPAATGLLAGDPLLRIDGDGFALVGRVTTVAREGAGERITFAADPEVVRTTSASAVVSAATPGSNLGWVLSTLAPETLRRSFEDRLRELWEHEHDSVMTELGPELRAAIETIARAFAARVPDAVARERELWQPLIERLRNDVFEAELAPVVREKVWPRIEAQVGQVAAAVGQELVSSFGFSTVVRALWAKAKDKVGIGAETAFREELERLLREQAMPVIQSHAGDLTSAALRGAGESWKDPTVRDALARAVERTLHDPEVLRVLSRLWSDIVNDDVGFREEVRAALSRPTLWAPMQHLAKLAEPILEQTLQEALLREDRQGLDLRLTQVLRNVLLWKDRRYALIEAGGGPLPSGTILAGRVAG